jgi:hypothetical protein
MMKDLGFNLGLLQLGCDTGDMGLKYTRVHLWARSRAEQRSVCTVVEGTSLGEPNAFEHETCPSI